MFLFATKNSVVSFLLGPGNGYERLNYIHRWSGRGMFIAATIHGALWIRNHLQFGLPVLGQQKETSGVAAFGVLCVIVLTSLRPARRCFHQVFYIVQYVELSIQRPTCLTFSQRTRFRFVLHHSLLPHHLCCPVDIPSARVLRS